ncbi:MAG: flagellar hook-associated protein 3 [Nitrospinaceae bacterium]|nr:MAG: flagellar hook-associated protein 3 [Nitrospinaceae bacterium]
MVERVTSQAIQNTVLNNIFRITEDLAKAQAEISSGKRILKPSDDPAGLRTSLSLRTSISESRQFIRNIDNNKIFIQSADTALQSVGLGLTRAKELAIAELGGASTPETRGFAALEIGQIISQVLEAANTEVKNQHIFAGTKTRTAPFQVSASGAIYQGNTESFKVEIAENIRIGLTLPGSDVLGTDLNPDLTQSTPLSVLNGGGGVPSGQFAISDRSGNSATITVSSGATLGTVISAINSAGVNVSASLNSSANGITLTDTSSVITQALTVTEVSGGTTASGLGILGQRNGNLEGRDLNGLVTAATAVSELNGGNGLTLGDISITNGAASGTVSLSSATTVGDVLSLINGSGFNVTASINSAGNGLRIVSNDPATVAVVNDIGVGTTGESLGLGGGRNVLDTLVQLKLALEKDDPAGIIASLQNLDKGLDSINESRAFVGASLRRIESTDFILDQDIVDQTGQLSNTEDADAIQRASDLASLEVALNATLSTTARILQPSLLDFLR